MRNMTPEENEQLKRIYEEIKKRIDDQTRQALVNGNWGPSPISRFPPLPPVSYLGISPTDVEARGMYSYQEPEVDEQGTYYGYKILVRQNMDCPCPECSSLMSPRYRVLWKDGELTSDVEPGEKTMYGIHFTKRPDHPELSQYLLPFRGAIYGDPRCILVKCALSGTIVETEQGFRAQHAQIIGVCINGNWQSYQDYQERTRPDPYRVAEKERYAWRWEDI